MSQRRRCSVERKIFKIRDGQTLSQNSFEAFPVSNGMKKDFWKWHEKKEKLHDAASAPFYHEREIWWCALGMNIGSEQDGSGDEYRRPVLILKGLSVKTCLVVPLTTSSKKHLLRPRVGVVEEKEAYALLSQLRVIDTKRLIRKVGYLEKGAFEIIRKAVKDML